MVLPKLPVRLFPLIVILLVTATSVVFLYNRSPVLLITDASFDLLYGPARARLKQAVASFRLLRPVRPVTVSETAGPDLIVISVQAASPKPYAVLFPYRYETGALRYFAENPGAFVAVFGGRRQIQKYTGGPRIVLTDVYADLYRAGCAAALLAGENPGNVLFFHDETVDRESREAFSSGLSVSGRSESPVFIGLSSPYSQWNNTACVVANGSAAAYFERNSSLPAILFTWADPEICPRGVKAVVDDSPWALAARAVKEMESGKEEVVLPSEFNFLYKRLVDRNLIKKLKILARS